MSRAATRCAACDSPRRRCCSRSRRTRTTCRRTGAGASPRALSSTCGARQDHPPLPHAPRRGEAFQAAEAAFPSSPDALNYHGEFLVESGDLGLSVIVFCCTALVCLAVLALRREDNPPMRTLRTTTCARSGC